MYKAGAIVRLRQSVDVGDAVGLSPRSLRMIPDALGDASDVVCVDTCDFRLITPATAVFVLVSFEGPDPYSQAGGLGVRMSGLARTLAEAGYETHLFFVGDPALPGEQRTMDNRLVLHRWCQWISAYCPGGAYDGEEAKFADLTRSLPPYALDKILLPAIAAGKTPVVLLEEWQTAETACVIAQALRDHGVRERAVLFWNANNPYGFHRIDWHRLADSVTITAVSRYMRSIIRSSGADAFVIPNGISADLLAPVQRADVSWVRAALSHEPRTGLFFKMARWEREKGWAQALDAVGHAREMGRRLVLIGRGGGPNGVGGALASEASRCGLRAVQVHTEHEFRAQLVPHARAGVDVISLGFGVTPALARTLYAAADGVLANSVSEPFGLVGLEAMAAGGVAYTGGTGEDYAITGRNAVVLDTLDPLEIIEQWDALVQSPQRMANLRREARRTAREYAWPHVSTKLVTAVTRQARRQVDSVQRPMEEVRTLEGARPEEELPDARQAEITRGYSIENGGYSSCRRSRYVSTRVLQRSTPTAK
jgi:glycosyltransferase involved in cell wall biosynthesis